MSCCLLRKEGSVSEETQHEAPAAQNKPFRKELVPRRQEPGPAGSSGLLLGQLRCCCRALRLPLVTNRATVPTGHTQKSQTLPRSAEPAVPKDRSSALFSQLLEQQLPLSRHPFSAVTQHHLLTVLLYTGLPRWDFIKIRYLLSFSSPGEEAAFSVKQALQKTDGFGRVDKRCKRYCRNQEGRWKSSAPAKFYHSRKQCKPGSRIALKELLSKEEKNYCQAKHSNLQRVSNGPRRVLFSFFTSHETPDIHTGLSAMAPLQSFAFSQQYLCCQGAFGAGGNQNGHLNLSFPLYQSLNREEEARLSFPSLYLPSTLQQCLLPLLFLSHNIEPVKQSVQQMAAEASFPSFKLLFQTSPPHCGKLGN